jgi:hypothetical protein
MNCIFKALHFHKLLIIISLLVINTTFAQDSIRHRVRLLKSRLQKEHYSPKPFDDRLSQIVFWKTLHTLDSKGLLFTQAELSKLLLLGGTPAKEEAYYKYVILLLLSMIKIESKVRKLLEP